MSLKERLDNSSAWILDNPKTLTTMILTASIVGVLAFTSFATVFFLRQMWFFFVIFGVFDYAAIKKLVSVIKSIQLLGYSEALGGLTANDFVWRRGEKNGNSRYKGDEMGSERDEEKNRRLRKEVGYIYRQPK